MIMGSGEWTEEEKKRLTVLGRERQGDEGRCGALDLGTNHTQRRDGRRALLVSGEGQDG